MPRWTIALIGGLCMLVTALLIVDNNQPTAAQEIIDYPIVLGKGHILDMVSNDMYIALGTRQRSIHT